MDIRKSLIIIIIYDNNVLIIATVHLPVSEKAGLLKQKVEPQTVTDSYSNFAFRACVGSEKLPKPPV